MHSDNLKNKIKNLSKKYHQDIIKIRRELHINPELSFKEHKTSNYIRHILSKTDLDIESGVCGTGLTAFLRGKNDNKQVYLRADMDALPIFEENNLPFKSKNDGVMHACGHDVHMASLIGACKILSDLKEEIPGSIKFIFQPGEEVLPGGASQMIKEGVLESSSTIISMFGQHVFPELEVGEIGFCQGPIFSSTDEIKIKIIGKGGHAANAFECINPLLIASNILISLEKEINKNKSSNILSVLSFGKIEGLGSTNIIPDEINIEGTFRSMDDEWTTTAHEKIIDLTKQIAASFKSKCEVRIIKGYPCLKNDFNVTKRAINFANEYLGKEKVKKVSPMMYGEDFAYFAQKIPSCFYLLGVKNLEKKITSSLHTSTFDIDERALEVGMGLMAWICIKEFYYN